MPAPKSSVRVSRGGKSITFRGPIANAVFNGMSAAAAPPAPKSHRPPTAAQLAKTCAFFNTKHPVGTAVIYTSVRDDPQTARATKTRSEAWIMGGHSVMVMVEGVSGGVLVDHVVKSPPAAS